MRSRDRVGGTGRERLEGELLVGREARLGTDVIDDEEHAEALAPRAQRHRQPAGAFDAELLQRLRSRRADPLARLHPGEVRRPRPGADAAADRPRPALARRPVDDELRAFLEEDVAGARLHQRPGPFRDELEDAPEVRLATELAAQRRRRLQSLDEALEVGAPALKLLVGAGVVDRDRAPLGEDDQEPLVRLAEARAALLLGQVDVPVDLPADADRRADERRHLRMAGREAVGAGVIADPLEAERARVADQLAEDPVAPRERPDPASRLLVDPRVEEALRAGSSPRRGPRAPRSWRRSAPGPHRGPGRGPRRGRARRRDGGRRRGAARARPARAPRLPRSSTGPDPRAGWQPLGVDYRAGSQVRPDARPPHPA